MRLTVQSSPHVHAPDSVPMIMLRVIIALLPAYIFADVIFGPAVLITLAVSIVTALACEMLAKVMRKRAFQLEDLSAVLTALLFTMTLPPSVPVSVTIIGTAVAILFGKEIFGGLGSNIFNPALVGRAFVQVTFPVAMTNFTPPTSANLSAINAIAEGSGSVTNAFVQTNVLEGGKQVVDVVAGPTPLGFMKFDGIKMLTETLFPDAMAKATPALSNALTLNATEALAHVHGLPVQAERFALEGKHLVSMFFGNVQGCIGETSLLLLLIGGIFLILTRTIDWRVPVGMTLAVALVGGLLFLLNPVQYPTPLFHLTAGGFALGAFFMATDMVTSPVTPKGTWIYALLIGALIVLIRLFSDYPEGVMFSILLGNALVPLLNANTKPKIYGALPTTKKEAR